MGIRVISRVRSVFMRRIHDSLIYPRGPVRGAALALCIFALLASGRFAHGDVVVSGNVYPFDNIFTTNINEGVPTIGNFIDPFLEGPPNPQTPLGQPNWEGEESIVVGRLAGQLGYLEINAGAIGTSLRYQHLIIGGDAAGAAANEPEAPDPDSIETSGNGLVVITGFGALYNNDPAIIPPGVPIIFAEEATRLSSPAAADGYDAYVGYLGHGEMQIVLGGRAEIQDAVAVGLFSTASGFLRVDGVGSMLTSGGGFEVGTGGDPTEVHHFSVGQYGQGEVRITNGGQVVSRAPIAETAATVSFGAAIGGTVQQTASQPEDLLPGGQGVVTVDGSGSRWTIGGGLQLGSFFGDIGDRTSTPEDIDGHLAQYDSGVGRGTLSVSNGGRVTIVNPDPTGTATEPSMRLQIGRYGVLDLNGGHVVVGEPTTGSTTNPLARSDDTILVNDGEIRGSGRIDTGVFRNRYLGQVHVESGDHLIIASTSVFDEQDEDNFPLENFGIIDVHGGELEIQRASAPDQDGDEIVQPFFNRLLADPPPPLGGRIVGQIVANDAVMRFPSGLVNEGAMDFFGSNVVSLSGSGNLTDDLTNSDSGLIAIHGGADLTIEGGLTSNGLIDFVPPTGDNGASVDTWHSISFGDDSVLRMVATGGGQINLSSHVTAGDILNLNGRLEVELTGIFAENQVIEIMSGQNGMTGTFTSFAMSPAGDPDIFLFPSYDYDVNTVSLISFSIADAVGADFNGDGVVDSFDLAILEAFFGTPGPAGDANGDGIVDGFDLEEWNEQVGGPGMPGAGAGSVAGGFGSGSSSVPEPSAVALLASGWLAVIAARRRKS